MKRNAKNAYNVLKKAGLHLMHDNFTQGSHFEVSMEDTTHLNSWLDNNGKGKLYWADYWGEIIESDGTVALNNLLDRNGLYFEWVNTAVIAVYDA
jgi:hypothetical protein